MAKKSNKTAHVLNLLAGHDTAKDADEQTSTVENTSDNADSQAASGSPAQTISPGTVGQAGAAPGTSPGSTAQPAANAAAAPPVAAPAASPQNNIAVIDKTEEDPVAELIQQNLSKEFEAQMQQSQSANLMPDEADSFADAEPLPDAEPTFEAGFLSANDSEPLIDSETEPLTVSESEPLTVSESEPLTASDSEPLTVSESEALMDLEPEPLTSVESEPLVNAESEPLMESESEPLMESEPEPLVESEPISAAKPVSNADAAESQTAKAAEPVPESIPVQQTVPEPQAAAPETPLEPEEDFATVNVMEHIVNDKIIYFMRQFDVCTCSRCKADVTALTLNGLAPKYLVTMKAAVDPLLSFYTNRLISDVTVEATKACMIVKDNPRH